MEKQMGSFFLPISKKEGWQFFANAYRSMHALCHVQPPTMVVITITPAPKKYPRNFSSFSNHKFLPGTTRHTFRPISLSLTLRYSQPVSSERSFTTLMWSMAARGPSWSLWFCKTERQRGGKKRKNKNSLG